MDRSTFEPRELVFLCGAGVSLDPPSGFPIAATIIEDLVREIAPNPAAHDHLLRLCDPGREDKRSPGDYLRFEMLLDILSDWVDPELRILDFIHEFETPNDLHLSIASLALEGATVVTTNFDSLFELALLGSGAQPMTLCTDEHFNKWRELASRDRVPIFKIHGSFCRHDGHSCEPAKDSIEATLSQISRGVTGLVLTKPKASFLEHVLAGRHLVVVGYSGSDDLDLMPTLLQMKSVSFTWIQHEEGELREVSEDVLTQARSTPKVSRNARYSFFLRHLSRGPSGCVVAGPTRRILREWFDVPVPERTEGSGGFSFRTYAKDWGGETLRPVDRRLLLAEIYFRLSRFTEALHHLNGVLARDKEELGDELARILSTYSNALVQGGRFAEGLEAAKRSVDCLSPGASSRTRIRTRRQLAFSLFRSGEHAEALPVYEDCLRLALDEGLADEAGDAA